MVTRAQVLHVAKLAKLTLTPPQEELFAAQLGKILDYVALLDEIEDDAEELTHVAVFDSELRADVVRPSLPRDEILALAPKSDDETMLVPPVIEGGGSA